MSQEIAKQESAVPDLVRTPALEIDHEDVALPRIKIGQFMTGQVQEGLVKAGDIFASTSEDDADVLRKQDAKDDGLLFHVLTMRKGKSATIDGELETYDFHDPAAPADAWTTYNYFVCLPEVDDEVPYKWLLTRTGRPAAQTINTVLKKNTVRGPAWANAFRVTTAQRENQKGKFYVARVRSVEADPKHTEAAEALAVMMQSAPVAASAGATDEPAI